MDSFPLRVFYSILPYPYGNLSVLMLLSIIFSDDPGVKSRMVNGKAIVTFKGCVLIHELQITLRTLNESPKYRSMLKMSKKEMFKLRYV